jgi:hypothetical protein
MYMNRQSSDQLAPAEMRPVFRVFPGEFAARPIDLDLLSTSAEIRRWLVRRARSASGAVHAWVDAATGVPAFEYPEITGYALTFWAAQSATTEDELEAGRQAAGWLGELVESGRLYAREGWDSHAVYNFDLAMMANGLLAFGARHLPEAVTIGIRLAAYLGDQIERDGWLEPLDPGMSPRSSRSGWSTEGYAHLVKAAQCQLHAAALGLPDGVAAARAVVDRGLEFLTPEGRFVTQPSTEVTMLHSHLYAVEGLWIFAEATGDDEARDAAQAATEWAWRQQLPSGGFPRWAAANSRASAPEQFDVTAQAIRAAVLCGLDPDGLDRAVLRLANCGLKTPAGSALPYQPDTENIHENAWVSMFGAQAYESALAAAPRFDWTTLV